MKWRDIVKFLPLILQFIPQAKPILPFLPVIAQGITEAEDIKGATGPQKKEHVLNLVALAVEGVNSAAGKTVVGATSTQVAAGQVIDAAVAVANVIEETTKK